MKQALLSKALAFTLCCGVAVSVSAQSTTNRVPVRQADHIAAIVNQELVTAFEVEQRLARVREEAARARQTLPEEAELRKQVLELLIEERAILSFARDSGVKIEEPELDRAVASVAAQNQLTMAQLRERLRREGLDYTRFRNNLRDQMMIERVREREVQSRIKISDAEIDAAIERQRQQAAAQPEIDIAQILVTVPEGASDAVVAERRAKAEAAMARVKAGEAFATVAREVSEDANRERGGQIGMRPASRLPDVFVNAVANLKAGDVAPTLLRTGAGFHILKVVERKYGGALQVTQTHARHILLRPSAQVPAEVAVRRLAEFRQQIESGKTSFEALARANSEDGSAPLGGDLGWTSPGSFVPEFEEAMNRLPLMGISEPVTSRFGVHLIQVLERRVVNVDPKQLREQARNALREQKFDDAYNEWVRELRARAYVELREAPQQP
ncbi:peptidylprolyl isomerase [Aquincola tertiaricarbonis]|uniref:Chaperone SurA n=1 Tax=Aquincola tertiaricarbonis TaxID=391953 RepID=A0ABY4S9T6_AQUTE|nr:peptidylprolyl isomerase [Aquincola tertiaricarbonis]URI09754.1 peptidylprolyl isomerase [Aquincola tertiaricarbonis]